jgi:sodium-dependent phosphate cotransporter
LVGLQFVKGGVAGLAPKLDVWLPVLIRDAPSALGAGWLAAYVLFNGSVVAAIGLTFYEAALVPASHLLLVIFGSRLGAAGIVLIVGLADLVHNRSLTVRRASEVGILTFLVTHTTGIPALLLAFALIGAGSLKADAAAEQAPSWAFPIPHPIEQAAEALVSWTGPIGALAAGVLLLLAALRLVNHVFVEADFDDLRTRYRRVLKSRWIAAGIGCALTTLTTSIAFSLGVVVPIYNRGFLRRREIIPYILGAHVGTFVDTLAVSLFIERTGSLDVVLLATGSTVLVTLPVLLLFGPYRSAIERLTDAVMRRPRSFAVFLIALVAVPIGLLRIGAWIGS